MKTKFKTSHKSHEKSILKNRNFLNSQNYISDWGKLFYKNYRFAYLWLFILIIFSFPVLFFYICIYFWEIKNINNIIKIPHIVNYLIVFFVIYLIFIFTPKYLFINYINLIINKLFFRKKIYYLKPVIILKKLDIINDNIKKFIIKK